MKSNIILIGMPWSGKTSLWQPLAKATGRHFVDFDDDIIKTGGRTSVTQCLEELWEEGFLELEKTLALGLNIRNTVLSTSGSVALCLEAMEYLREEGTCIYIDVPTEIITTRLPDMKTGRIIWMQDWKNLEDVLIQRRESYEKSYDYRFVNDSDKSVEEVQNRFLNWFSETVK